MSGSVSVVQAGRIRDAARLTQAGGVFAVLALVISFFWPPAIVGFAAWPLAFGLLVVATGPLFAGAGTVAAVLVGGVGIVGAVLELVAIIDTASTGTFQITTTFGAGTIGIGAWMLGAAAIARALGFAPSPIVSKTARGGIGIGLIGVSWFVEDLVLSLLVLAAGTALLIYLTDLFDYFRTFGRPVDQPAIAPELPAP